jgi:hypothetical protein
MAIVHKQRKPAPYDAVEWTGTDLSLVLQLLGPDAIYYENGVLFVSTDGGRLQVPVGDNIIATPWTQYVAYVPYLPYIAPDPEAEPPIEEQLEQLEVLEVLWAPGVFVELQTDAEFAANYEDIPEE